MEELEDAAVKVSHPCEWLFFAGNGCVEVALALFPSVVEEPFDEGSASELLLGDVGVLYVCWP